MATKPLDKMTKPELVKALKAAQKRIAKLEGELTTLKAHAVFTVPAEDQARDGGPVYDWPAAEHTDEHGILKPMFPWNNEPESK